MDKLISSVCFLRTVYYFILGEELKCNMCDFSTLYNAQLKRHLSMQHGVQPRLNDTVIQTRIKNPAERYILDYFHAFHIWITLCFFVTISLKGTVSGSTNSMQKLFYGSRACV